jgi:macrolide phosphotransferase
VHEAETQSKVDSRAPMIDTMEDLLSAARAAGLALTSEDLEFDESGADFLVVHAVDERGVRWVVRTPRRDEVLERATLEFRALRLVGARLPVAVPDWRVFTAQAIAYPRLPGEPAAVVDFDAGGYVWRFDPSLAPAAFLETLARAIAALHGVESAAAAEAGLVVLKPREVREEWARRMDRARGTLDVPGPVWRRWQTWIENEGFWPEQTALVHGDLHPGHILVDDQHRVTGLLDWTEARVADPAQDFVLLVATLGHGPFESLLRSYEAAGGRVWPRMAAHIVEAWSAYPAVVADFATETGEDAHRKLAQALVDSTARDMTGA